MNIPAIEKAGKNYNSYMYEDRDIIPSNVYRYQIQLRKNMLEQELKNKTFDVVLDLGCGIGINSVILDSFTNKLLILSDLSKEAITTAKSHQYKNKIMVKVCDAKEFNINLHSKINLVHICGVLHHLPSDLDECISNLTKYTAKKTIVIVDEPNALNPFWWIVMKLSDADPVGNERPLLLSNILTKFKHYGYLPNKISYYAYFTPLLSTLTNNKRVLAQCEKIDLAMSKTFIKMFGWRWRIIFESF